MRDVVRERVCVCAWERESEHLKSYVNLMMRGKLSLAVSDSPRKLCFWWLQTACSPSFIGPFSPWLRKTSCWADDIHNKRHDYSINLDRCFVVYIAWCWWCAVYPLPKYKCLPLVAYEKIRRRKKKEITEWKEKAELNALVTLYELNIRMNNLVVKIRGQTQTEAWAPFSRRRLM